MLPSLAWARPVPEASAYQKELEQKGLADRSVATPERLADEVRLADEELVQGRPAAAAARLWAIVEGPRWQDFSDSDAYQDAEYRLGLALHKGGGSQTARKYLARVLARGQQAPFYEAALRTYADTCLDDHSVAACVAELDKLQPQDPHGEVLYLRGRAAFEAGRLKEADDSLSRISPESRFYSSALYLRGVARVKRGDYRGARDAFCEVAGPPEVPGRKTTESTLRFFVDGRYYHLRDLARLALGRLAHEERQYDDAFYHYFLIPQDSTKLADALFEAAWSSLERREFDLGARLVTEFLKLYPNSPRASEARLLRATLEVKTCRFADASQGFDAFLKEFEPLTAAVDKAINDPATLQSITARLIARARGGTLPESDAMVKAIAEQLELDARFDRLQEIARGLHTEANDAAHVVDDWRQLSGKVSGTRVQAVGADPAQLAEGLRDLGKEIARSRGKVPAADLQKLEEKRQQLLSDLQPALEKPKENAENGSGLVALVRADLQKAEELRKRSAALDGRLEGASRELVKEALQTLRGRMEQLLKRARLGRIDAVVGEKRKLEREIEDLAAGRFPPELFGKLHIEGLIGDDEVYWPPEKERWADEYEKYK
jgi:outer membrane protein assembly factor BamD (BamD/ComL family)